MENENRVVFLSLPKTRVYLRPPERSDLPFFRQALNNENIAKFLMRHSPITEMDQNEWFENLPKKKEMNRQFSVVLKEDNSVIGSVGLHNIQWIDRTTTAGAMIGREDLLNQKLGREAIMIMVRYAFQTLNLRQVHAQVYEFNDRSMRCIQKCGFVEIAKFPKFIYRGGSYFDLIHFMATRETWRPLWLEFEIKMS